jgi:hypothetical protein
MKKQLLTLSIILVLIASFSFLSAFAYDAADLAAATFTHTPGVNNGTIAAPAVGDTLTAVPTQTLADPAFKWYREAKGDITKVADLTTQITGETTNEYTLVGDDGGKFIYAVVTQLKGDRPQTGDPKADQTEDISVLVKTSAAVAVPDGDFGELKIASETLVIDEAPTGSSKAYWRFSKGTELKGKWTAFAGTEALVTKSMKKDAGIFEIWVTDKDVKDFTKATTPALGSQKIPVQARPEKPAKITIDSFVDDQGRHVAIIANDLKGMEYRALNYRGGWITAADNAKTEKVPVMPAAQSYEFRVAAVEANETTKTAAKPGSPVVKMKIPAFQKAPAPKVDLVKSTVKFNAKWEIQNPLYEANSTDALTKDQWISGTDLKLLTIFAGGEYTTEKNLAKGNILASDEYPVYLIRAKADAGKKPVSPAVAIRIPEPELVDFAEDATAFFAVDPKGKLLPAQGVLLEYLTDGKWKKGLPKGNITSAQEFRMQGSAIAPASVSYFFTYSYTAATSTAAEVITLKIADTSAGVADAEKVEFTEEEEETGTGFTVSFNANGGTGTMAALTNQKSIASAPSNTFTAPDGKEFDYWSLTATGAEVNYPLTITKNETLYAIWKTTTSDPADPTPEAGDFEVAKVTAFTGNTNTTLAVDDITISIASTSDLGNGVLANIENVAVYASSDTNKETNLIGGAPADAADYVLVFDVRAEEDVNGEATITLTLEIDTVVD